MNDDLKWLMFVLLGSALEFQINILSFEQKHVPVTADIDDVIETDINWDRVGSSLKV